jgi:hypothetical protein
LNLRTDSNFFAEQLAERLRKTKSRLLKKREDLIKKFLDDTITLQSSDIQVAPPYVNTIDYKSTSDQDNNVHYVPSEIGICEDCLNEDEIFPDNDGRYLCLACSNTDSYGWGVQEPEEYYSTAIGDREKAKKSIQNKIFLSVIDNFAEDFQGESLQSMKNLQAVTFYSEGLMILLMSKQLIKMLSSARSIKKPAAEKRTLSLRNLTRPQYLNRDPSFSPKITSANNTIDSLQRFTDPFSSSDFPVRDDAVGSNDCDMPSTL